MGYNTKYYNNEKKTSNKKLEESLNFEYKYIPKQNKPNEKKLKLRN